MLGYQDCNDEKHLKNDPILKEVLEGDLCSQPTLSRFENSFSKHDILGILYGFIEHYVSSLKGRKKVIIDIDATDDPTHGSQQLSLFNGFYGQFMYNELFFHDGETGEVILPVLRPGNSHSNKWYVGILKRIVKAIREKYPTMNIIIRADSGFSCPQFYELVAQYNLEYAVGIGSNQVLKKRVKEQEQEVRERYLEQGKKHQCFVSHTYQAKSWKSPQKVYTKIESTGKGMNIRHIVSNFTDQTPEEIYHGFYVKRGESSENRIKEIKNMCFSDRLSDHRFWANFFRLIMSTIAYKLFLVLKEKIQKTDFQEAKKWQIDTIRTRLLKIGATIKITQRRVYYKLSQAFVFKDLFYQLATG